MKEKPATVGTIDLEPHLHSQGDGNSEESKTGSPTPPMFP